MSHAIDAFAGVTVAEKMAVLDELCTHGPFANRKLKYSNLFIAIMRLGIEAQDRVTVSAIAQYLEQEADDTFKNQIKQHKQAIAQKLRDWNHRGASKLPVYVEMPSYGCTPVFQRRPGSERTARLAAHRAEDAAREEADGRVFLHSWDGDRTAQAIAHFTAAVKAEPRHAPAFAALAEAYGQAAYWADQEPASLRIHASRAAKKALVVSVDSSDAHWAMGSISSSFFGSNAVAERHFREAVRLDRANATAYSLYATTLLAPLGRAREALAAADMAVSVARDGIAYHRSNRGWVLFYAGRLKAAIDEWQESLRRFPAAFSPTYGLACAFGELGHWDDCFGLLEALIRRFPKQTELVALLAYFRALRGDRRSVEELAQGLIGRSQRAYVPALCLAISQLALAVDGKRVNRTAFERSFRLLEEAHREGDIRLRWLAVNPVFKMFRKHRDYPRLVQELNLA